MEFQFFKKKRFTKKLFIFSFKVWAGVIFGTLMGNLFKVLNLLLNPIFLKAVTWMNLVDKFSLSKMFADYVNTLIPMHYGAIRKFVFIY